MSTTDSQVELFETALRAAPEQLYATSDALNHDEFFNELVEMAPNEMSRARVLSLWGRALARVGKWDEAAAKFVEAEPMADERPYIQGLIQLNLAKVLWFSGDLDAALTYAKKSQDNLNQFGVPGPRPAFALVDEIEDEMEGPALPGGAERLKLLLARSQFDLNT